MCKYFPIYEEAVCHRWLCIRSLWISVFMRKFIFFFISSPWAHSLDFFVYLGGFWPSWAESEKIWALLKNGDYTNSLLLWAVKISGFYTSGIKRSQSTCFSLRPKLCTLEEHLMLNIPYSVYPPRPYVNSLWLSQGEPGRGTLSSVYKITGPPPSCGLTTGDSWEQVSLFIP